MKTTKKLILLFALLLAAFILNGNCSYAKTTPVNDEEELIAAIEGASDGDVIELTTTIKLSTPLEIADKVITIDGKGNTITKDESDWHTSSANGTLITAGSTPEKSAKVTLKNLTLTKAEKYGAQAYNKGYLVLDGVTIYDCGYGGVISNAGTVEVVNLHLGQNGQYENNGIELAKSAAIKDDDNNPKLIMNGTLTSTEDVNVVYIAINDALSTFEVDNTENTTNKIFVSGDKLVITDQNNNVIFESNSTDKVAGNGDTFIPNVTITVYLMEDSATNISVISGTTISMEALQSQIDLKALGFENYTIEGFYSDNAYTTKFNFENPITTDVTMYAKLVSNESSTPAPTPEPAPEATTPKDETPKTGIQGNIVLALSVIALSSLAILTLKRKDI